MASNKKLPATGASGGQRKKVLVVGGGNSGCEEGLFLSKFASQASKRLTDKVAEMPTMSVTVNMIGLELKSNDDPYDSDQGNQCQRTYFAIH